jgi:hypothetical protein
MKTLSLISATLLGLLTPVLASAQGRPWVSDRGYGEGMGYRTGDLELHPGVAGEVGYDSNYFQRSGDPTRIDSPISSALRFRLTPSLTLSTLSPQRRLGDAAGTAPPTLNFRAGIFASYNELFGLSGSDDFSKQRNVDGGANVLFDILPQRPVGADVSATFSRMVSPSNDPSTSTSWNRDSIGAGAGVTWRPGGGLFDWRLGYAVLYNYFEKATYQNLNNVRNTVDSRGRWKFLPRTAAIFDAKSEWSSYTSGATAPRNGGQAIQARLGINGLVTNHFGLLVLAGWGATYYTPTAVPVRSNYDSVVGQAELKWYILPQPTLQPGTATVGLSTVAVGYLRDFTNSYLADYYQRDRGYANLSYFVGGRYLIDIQAGYSHITHPEFVRNGADISGLTENRVDAQLFTEYRTSDSFGINATLRFDGSLSNAYLTTPAVGTTPQYTDNLAFRRFTGFLGARWFL